MFEDYTICPYPGLRSFNEDESIYFKGRDHHTIEVIQLLQKNKFLMVTGASGDGKSSLVFGGLIPNAKAGFFKARYNNWKVAQFRPERDPLTNLSKSLANALEIADVNSAETELQRGYSSLVELYKNSDFYEDEQKIPDSSLKKTHANLLIIVDQFEEIFTNPENYSKGVPSHRAQVTINLLLETAKIALKDNLPIFVVFTMRSDYIGQCTAFRGLPEHIGFSQFFVPRLKRKALKQIVQEPAKLSGCSISNRLVERMLFDLGEGVDQLPVLQHALNQVWLAADNGTVEMDLIHYAKVGGMAVSDLPNGDVDGFNNWFTKLPEWKKPLFENPSLNNVLDIHADLLYNGAAEYYNKRNPKEPITIKEGKYIIAMTFAGLTKIDDSRAVRNRMSLREITNIINKNHFDARLVGEVINYFREPGNTFIHPFINGEDEETETLEIESVLDVTHEALIRNWSRLNKWAEKEFEYFEIYKDLKKQVDRWVDNNRSKRYLLSIGPLSYFETWYDECNPNKYWISRYLDSSGDKKHTLKVAENILEDIKELLRRSKNNLIVTRTVMKYGSTRIATFLAILVVLFLSSFYYIDAKKKQNEQVLLTVSEKSTELIVSPEVNLFNKGFFMIYLERLKKGSFYSKLASIDEIDKRVEIANNTYFVLLHLDRTNRHDFKIELSDYIKSSITKLSNEDTNFKLRQYNDFAYTLSRDWYFNENEYLKGLRAEVVKEMFEFVTHLIKSQDANIDALELNMAIDYLLSIGLSEDKIEELIDLISPYQNHKSKINFDFFYPLAASISFNEVTIKHNGGYQVLASLHAANGDYDLTVQSVDSLIIHNNKYFLRLNSSSGHNIVGYLEKYGHTEYTDQLISYMASKRNIDKSEFYKELHDRSGYIKAEEINKFFTRYYYSNILTTLTMDNHRHLAELWVNSIKENTNEDAVNFQMALALKHQASNFQKISQDRSINIDPQKLTILYNKAISHYLLVSESYLDKSLSTTYRYYGNGSRRRDVTRRHMFLYPDLFVDGFYNNSYSSPLFVDYLIKSDNINRLYQSAKDLELFNDWIANYLEIDPNFNENSRNVNEIPNSLLNNLLSVLAKHPEADEYDANLIKLLVANNHFESNEVAFGLKLFELIDLDQVAVTATRWEYLNMTAIYNEMVQLSIHLYKNGSKTLAVRIIDLLPDAYHQIPAYCVLANALYESGNPSETFVAIDSIMSKREQIDDRNIGGLDYRLYMLTTLGKIGGRKMSLIAENMLTNMPDFNKPNGIIRYVIGQANEGNFNNAFESVSSDLSDDSELVCYLIILAEGQWQSNSSKQGWENFDQGYYDYNEYIVFNANF